MARLISKYKDDVLPALQGELGRKNVHDLPRITKICLNMGLGRATEDNKIIDEAVDNLRMISGQQPAICRSKMAVSNFKLRENMRIGARVTLRGPRMYEFLDRFISFAIPRIRDFQGISDKGFDRQGNYSVGVEEVSIFPEINADVLQYNLGMDVTIVIENSRGRDESRMLLEKLGMPFVQR